jgi:transcriptional regulator with XRE-family HTH domain
MMQATTEKEKGLRYLAFSADLLVQLRKHHNVNQVQLAEVTGISQSTISFLEKGREPSLDVMKRLGKFFNVYFVADWSGIHGADHDSIV